VSRAHMPKTVRASSTSETPPTTKRGQSTEPRFNVTQRLGFFELAHELGARAFRDSADAVTVFGDSARAGQICRGGCPVFDPLPLRERVVGEHREPTG